MSDIYSRILTEGKKSTSIFIILAIIAAVVATLGSGVAVATWDDPPRPVVADSRAYGLPGETANAHGTASIDGASVAGSVAPTVDEFQVYNVSTGMRAGTHRMKFVLTDVENGTVTVDVSPLLDDGVNASAATATVVDENTYVGSAGNASYANGTVTIAANDTNNNDDINLYVELQQLNTTAVEAPENGTYTLEFDEGNDGTVDASTTDTYSLVPIVEWTGGGPAEITPARRTIVTEVTVAPPIANPIHVRAFDVGFPGNVSPRDVRSISIRGDASATRARPGGFAGETVTVPLSQPLEATFIGQQFSVRMTLRGNTTVLDAGDVVRPNVSLRIAPDDGVAGNTTDPEHGADGNGSVVRLPIRSGPATLSNATASATATYRANVTVADPGATATYDSLTVTLAPINGDWTMHGGSLSDASLQDVAVTVNGTSVVDPNGTITASTTSITVPLTGNRTLRPGDALSVAIEGVENPDVLGTYPLRVRLNPSGVDFRAAAAPAPSVTGRSSNTTNVAVSSAVEYERNGAHWVAFHTNRSLAAAAVEPADVSVDARRGEVAVTNVSVGADGRRIVAALAADVNASATLSAWGDTASITTTTETIEPGDPSGSAFSGTLFDRSRRGGEQVAVVFPTRDETADVYVNGTNRTRIHTGSLGRVAVVDTRPYDANGSLIVDFDADGIDGDPDVELALREPSVILIAPTEGGEVMAGSPSNATWTAAAPAHYRVELALTYWHNDTEILSAVHERPSNDTHPLPGLSSGRYQLAFQLVDESGQVVGGFEYGRVFSAERLRERWSRTDYVPDLAVHDGTAYLALGSANAMAAVDVHSGSERYNATLGASASRVAVDDAGAYVLLGNGSVVALDDQGDVRWRTDAFADRTLQDLVVGNDTVYLLGGDWNGSDDGEPNGIAALSTATGAQRWTASEVGSGYALRVEADDEYVVVATGSTGSIQLTTLYANGTVAWTAATSRTNARQLALREDEVIVGYDYERTDSLERRSIENGSVVGQYDVEEPTAIGVSGDGTAVASGLFTTSVLHGRHSSTFDQRWSYYGLRSIGGSGNAIELTNDTIVVAGEDDSGHMVVRGLARPPAVVATPDVSPRFPRVGDSITFDATASLGPVSSVNWTLPDGNTSTPVVNRTFDDSGVYETSLTVTSTDPNWTDRRSVPLVVSRGERAWTAGQRTALPTVVGNRTIAWNESGAFVARDAATGSVAWRRSAPGWIPRPDAHALARQGSGVVAATSWGITRVGADGHYDWNYSDVWSAEYLGTDGERVYVANESGTVAAVDPATGSEQWRATTGGDIEGVAAAGGRVYVLAEQGGGGELPVRVTQTAYAFDGATGAESWNRTVFDAVGTVDAIAATPSGPVLASDATVRIYATNGSNVTTITPRLDVDVLDARDGTIYAAGTVRSSSSDSAGVLAAYDRTGATRWAYGTPGALRSVSAGRDAIAVRQARSGRAIATTLIDPPSVQFDAPETVTVGDTLTLEATLDAVADAPTYRWSTPAGPASGENVTVTFDATGTRSLGVSVDLGNGLVLDANETVTVESAGSGGAYFPPPGGGDGSPLPRYLSDASEIRGLVDVLRGTRPAFAERVSIRASRSDRSIATFSTNVSVRSVAMRPGTDGTVTVTRLAGLPSTAPAVPGQPAAIFQVSANETVESDITSLRADIPTESIPSGYAVQDLQVLQYDAGSWERLDTAVVDRTSDRVIVEATPVGASVFTVAAVERPTASFSVQPQTATPNGTITLDASDASTPFGEIVRYEWSVGGRTLTGATVNVSFEETGRNTVELAITTDAGRTANASQTVAVEPPTAADAGTGDGTPGFGVVVGLLAILGAVAVLRRG